MLDLLKHLTSDYAPTGSERNFTTLLTDLLNKVCSSVKTDNMGNILAVIPSKKPNAKRILLDAHFDEVALVVTGYEKNGFVRFASPFGYDIRTLSSKEVVIHGKSRINGVITSIPPHLLKEDSNKYPKEDELFIDTGYSSELLETVIPKGTAITSRAHLTQLNGDFYSLRALDNKLGVTAVLAVLDRISKTKLDCEVAVSFSVQEEAGLRGAGPAAFNINPDVCIVLDVSHAYTPGAKKEKCGECGKGPMIGISPVLSKSISDKLIITAKKSEIPYQLEVMGGSTGTNANIISKVKFGIPTGLVSIPIKYMHTPAEVFKYSDLTTTVNFICEFLKYFNNDL